MHPVELRIWPPPEHTLLQLPDLLSPYAGQLEQRILRWADEFEVLDDDRARAKLEHTRLGELIARSYPHVTADRLDALAGWFLWAFVIDDCYDDLVGDYDAAAERVLSVLRGERVAGMTRLDALLARVTELVVDGRSRHWRARFEQHMGQFLAGFKYEAVNRAGGRTPNLLGYTQLRRATGGITPSLDLLEVASGHEVPALLHETEQFRILFNRAADVVVWVNDVVSLEKELRSGETSNGVLVLRQEMNLPTQGAIDAVYDLVDGQIEQFERARTVLFGLLPGWSGLTVTELAAVDLFVEGLQTWMRGNLEWSRNCARYRVVDGVRLSTDARLVNAVKPVTG
ncbi:hypothetical protein DMC64_36900 [Amycolatopsis sp. WAC 04197]|uniref:terpene synthase family protein n=1 Tax=Amycolatopsis sp. WAC 04197 TaxID=2203199 RepID=UPI000F7B3C6D|nr:hypothetical protein [Amycolatopsis sp. WAC 04197]RSN39904.1 hypothetical protein DMC64_36900 [Amycolatopsis sp. WAC 04197]